MDKNIINITISGEYYDELIQAKKERDRLKNPYIPKDWMDSEMVIGDWSDSTIFDGGRTFQIRIERIK